MLLDETIYSGTWWKTAELTFLSRNRYKIGRKRNNKIAGKIDLVRKDTSWTWMLRTSHIKRRSVCSRFLHCDVMKRFQREETITYHKIHLFPTFRLLPISCNSHLDPCLKFALQHSGRKTGTSIRNASLKVLQCWRSGPLHLLLRYTTGKKVYWSQVIWIWRPLFETTTPDYLISEFLHQVLVY